MLHVNGDQFEAKVLASTKPVLVDFWAEWCGPCRMLAPVLEEIAAEEAGRLDVAKVNVDTNQELAARYGIMGIPTMVLFEGGREVRRLVGFQPKEQIKAQLAGTV